MSQPISLTSTKNVWHTRGLAPLPSPSQAPPEPKLIESNTPRGKLFAALTNLGLIDANGLIASSGGIYLDSDQHARLLELYERPFRFSTDFYTFKHEKTYVTIHSFLDYLRLLDVRIADVKLVGRGIYYVLGPNFLFEFLKRKLGTQYEKVMDDELIAYVQAIARREPSDIDVRFIIANPLKGEKVYSLEYYLACLEEHMASKILIEERREAIECLNSKNVFRTRQGPPLFSETFLWKRKIVKSAEEYIILSVGEKKCPLDFMLWREKTVPVAPNSTKSLELSFLTRQVHENGWKPDQVVFDKLLKINRFRQFLDYSFWGAYIESLCDGSICSKPESEQMLHDLMEKRASKETPLPLLYAIEANKFLESHAKDKPFLAKIYLLNALCFFARRGGGDVEMRQFLDAISFKINASHPFLDALLSPSNPPSSSFSLLAKLSVLALHSPKTSFKEFTIVPDEEHPNSAAQLCFFENGGVFRLSIPFSWARLTQEPKEENLGSLKPIVEPFGVLETPKWKEGDFFKQEELSHFYLSLFGVASGDHPSFFQQLQRLMERNEQHSDNESVRSFIERARSMLKPDLIYSASPHQMQAIEWLLVKLLQHKEKVLLNSLLISYAKCKNNFLVKTKRFVSKKEQEKLAQQMLHKIARECNWTLFISVWKKFHEEDSPLIPEGFKKLVAQTLSKPQNKTHLTSCSEKDIHFLFVKHHVVLEDKSFKELYFILVEHHLNCPKSAFEEGIFSLYQCAVNRFGVQADLLPSFVSLSNRKPSSDKLNGPLIRELMKGKQAGTLNLQEIAPFVDSLLDLIKAENIKGFSEEEYASVFWLVLQNILTSKTSVKGKENIPNPALLFALLQRLPSLDSKRLPSLLSSEDYDYFLNFLSHYVVTNQNMELLELLLQKLPKGYLPKGPNLIERFLDESMKELMKESNPTYEELTSLVNWVIKRSSHLSVSCLERTYLQIVQVCSNRNKPDEQLLIEFYYHVKGIVGAKPVLFSTLIELLLPKSKNDLMEEPTLQFLLQEGVSAQIEPKEKLPYLARLPLTEKHLRKLGELYPLCALPLSADLDDRSVVSIMSHILKAQLTRALEGNKEAFDDLDSWRMSEERESERVFVHSLLLHLLAKELPPTKSIPKKSCISYGWIEKVLINSSSMSLPNSYHAHYIEFERNLLSLAVKETVEYRGKQSDLSDLFFDIHNIIKDLPERSIPFKISLQLLIDNYPDPTTKERFSIALAPFSQKDVQSGRSMLSSITSQFFNKKGFILTWRAELQGRGVSISQDKSLFFKLIKNLKDFPLYDQLEVINMLHVNMRFFENQILRDDHESWKALVDVQVSLFINFSETMSKLPFQNGTAVYAKVLDPLMVILNSKLLISYYSEGQTLQAYVKLLRVIFDPMIKHLDTYTFSPDKKEEERDSLLAFSKFFAQLVLNLPYSVSSESQDSSEQRVHPGEQQLLSGKGKKGIKKPLKAAPDPLLSLTLLYVDWLEGLYKAKFHYIYGLCLTVANGPKMERPLEDYLTRMCEKGALSEERIEALTQVTVEWGRMCRVFLDNAKDRLPSEIVTFH